MDQVCDEEASKVKFSTNMLPEKCLIELIRFINGACCNMAPVIKETLGVPNFDGVRTYTVYEYKGGRR